MSDNPTTGLTQYDLNTRLIQNDDEFRKSIKTLSEDVAVIKNTITTHLDNQNKSLNVKLTLFGIVAAAGTSISVIFL